MGALQQGHWSGSAPQTLRMRSRHKGRMERALCFGGAGTRRIWDCGLEIEDCGLGGDAGGRMIRVGIVVRLGRAFCWSRRHSIGPFAGLQGNCFCISSVPFPPSHARHWPGTGNRRRSGSARHLFSSFTDPFRSRRPLLHPEVSLGHVAGGIFHH